MEQKEFIRDLFENNKEEIEEIREIIRFIKLLKSEKEENKIYTTILHST